jgi:rubrerythrin
MAKEPTDLGRNRTGISLSPIDSKDLIETASNTAPSMEGDEQELVGLRSPYLKEEIPVGTMPIPVTPKGMATSAMEMLKGKVPTVLLDKLGQRLAFERTGTRLYEAVIGKVEARSANPGEASRKLRQIHDQEAQHFDLLCRTMKELGADPTAMTPCADVSAVASMGLLQVVTDPRTTITQSLDALLTAEATDVEGWQLLIKLTEQMGHAELSERFRECEQHEVEHLSFVRALLNELTLLEAQGKTPHI